MRDAALTPEQEVAVRAYTLPPMFEGERRARVNLAFEQRRADRAWARRHAFQPVVDGKPYWTWPLRKVEGHWKLTATGHLLRLLLMFGGALAILLAYGWAEGAVTSLAAPVLVPDWPARSVCALFGEFPIRIYAPVSARVLGTVGDGSTNNQPYIQAASDACTAMGGTGGVIRGRHGDNYRIWSEVKIQSDNVTFGTFGAKTNPTGSGSNPQAGGMVISVRPSFYTDSYAIRVQQATPVRCLTSVLLQGFSIHCAATATSGIYCQTMYSKTYDVKVFNSTANGVVLEGLTAPGGFPGLADLNEFNRIEVATTNGTTGNGIYLTGGGTTSDNKIIDCDLSNKQYGIYGDPGAGGLQIIGCHIGQTSGPGCYFTGSGGASGVICLGNRFHDTFGGFYVMAWGRSTCTIAGNLFTLPENAATNTWDAIHFECDPAHLANRLRGGVIGTNSISLKAASTIKWRYGLYVGPNVDNMVIESPQLDWDSTVVNLPIGTALIHDEGFNTLIDGRRKRTFLHAPGEPGWSWQDTTARGTTGQTDVGQFTVDGSGAYVTGIGYNVKTADASNPQSAFSIWTCEAGPLGAANTKVATTGKVAGLVNATGTNLTATFTTPVWLPPGNYYVGFALDPTATPPTFLNANFTTNRANTPRGNAFGDWIAGSMAAVDPASLTTPPSGAITIPKLRVLTPYG